jgi:hypothetical protein
LITVKREGIIDPLKFQQKFWPDITFYDKQRQIIYSTIENDETVSPAANVAGKDFVSAFVALYFFCSRDPVRVVTTSVKDDHLRVLWGEIMNLVSSSKYPMRSSEGGNLVCNHHEIKKIVRGKLSEKSYMIGMVAAEGAALQGHHLPRGKNFAPHTLFVVDEASGVPDLYYEMASTWFHRALIIGNPWACNNFFYKAVKGRPGTEDRGGDIPRPDGNGYYRKIIQIKGTDSPNVRYGLLELAAGRVPTNKIITPGVLPYSEYVKRRMLWDKVKQTVSIDGEFYEGAETMMFPPEWLARAEKIAAEFVPYTTRTGRAIGCDPAEGGDSSCWSVVDGHGLIKLISLKTPDTNLIPYETIRLMKLYKVDAKNVWFDRGGGGKQHVDRLRSMGHEVRTVAFGEPASEADLFKRYKRMSEKREEKEDRTVYKNRRAEMYGIIRELIDPSNEPGFGLPGEYHELRRQLAPIPLRYGREGQMYLLPKHKEKSDSTEECLYDLLGCSPDEADSLALAVFGLMMSDRPQITVGAVDV